MGAGQAAVSFFRKIFPNASGYFLTLWTLPTKIAVHLPANDFEAIARNVDAMASQEAVYFGVGLHSRALESTERGRLQDVTAIPGFWLDLDVKAPRGAHSAQDLPTLEQAGELLESFPLAPTVVVHSGWGLQAYWLFPELEPVLVQGCPLSAQFQDWFIRRGKELGFHVDASADLTRVLRVPGTENRKVHGSPKPVFVIEDEGPRHTLASISSHLKGSGAPSVETAQAAHPAIVTPEGATDSQNTPASPPRSSLELVKARLAKSTRQAVKSLLAGLPFARTGEREKTLTSLCQAVANIAPDGDPEELAGLFMPSLEAMLLEDPPTKLRRKDVLDRLRRGLGKKQKELEQAKPLVEALKLKTSPQDTPGEQPLIVQKGDAFWVRAGDKYKTPVNYKELPQALHRDVPGIDSFVDDDGEVRQKKLSQVLREHAYVARNLRASMAISASKYDYATETFLEAVCVKRPLEPKFTPEIAEWLELFCGEAHEKVLDWMATADELEAQTCALYLRGAPDTGKTNLFARGIAQRWTDEGPTPLASVVGSFNEDLLNCPVVLADETLPENVTSGGIRSLIGNDIITIRRKYLKEIKLQLGIRLIIAANNDNLLNFNELLGSDDIRALGTRFLYVNTPEAAAAYIRQLNARHPDAARGGGHPATDEWIRERLIARHALWLAQNRDVKRGKRFRVHGEETRFHRSLATRRKSSSLVTEWLAKFLDDPKTEITRTGLVLVGDGRFLVNSDALSKFWGVYVQSQPLPFARVVLGQILRSLSIVDKKRIRQCWYYDISLPFVLEYAEDHGLGDAEKMQARVNAKVVDLAEEGFSHGQN